MHSSTALAFAASLSTALAAQQGFNYASTFSNNVAKQESDFATEFNNAKNLAGTNKGFTSARLYTMIQAHTTSEVISAIPAALAAQGTHLLLGMWASGGDIGIDNELAALNSSIKQYGSSLKAITNGIAVGSEDLYRISPTGVENNSTVGAGPDTVVAYINKVKEAIAGTALEGVPVGHVDTWTAWVNASNSAVVEASDFIGMDAYPYFQNTFTNPIEQGKSLFESAYSATQDNAQGKPVWITETGWPVTGETENKAVPSPQNAKTYWDQVGCPLFGNTNVYWYTLEDNDGTSTTPSPSFGVITSESTTPLYDLSCSNTTTSSSSSSSSSSSPSTLASATKSQSTATGTGVFASGTGVVASGTAVPSGGFGSSNGTSGFGSGSSSGSSSGSGSGPGSGAAGGTGKSGPSPTSASKSTFTGGAASNGGSVACALGVVMAVAVCVL